MTSAPPRYELVSSRDEEDTAGHENANTGARNAAYDVAIAMKTLGRKLAINQFAILSAMLVFLGLGLGRVLEIKAQIRAMEEQLGKM